MIGRTSPSRLTDLRVSHWPTNALAVLRTSKLPDQAL